MTQAETECGDDITPLGLHGNDMKKIPVILLAAGQSQRMGGADKLIQKIDGVPLLRRMAQIAEPVGPVIVALPPAPHPRYEVLKGLDVLTEPIPNASEGMNASLRGALTRVPQKADAVMVLLSDLPELTSDDLLAVSQSMISHPHNLIWRGATNDGKPGHPVIFHHSLFPQLSELSGDSGAQAVVRNNIDRLHLQILPNQNALMDLDTPEEWAIWQAKRAK